MNDKGKTFFEKLAGTLKVDGETGEPKVVDFTGSRGETTKGQSPSGRAWMEQAQEGQLTLDVYQTATDIVIKSTVAGVTPEDLDVTITNDMVTIKGNRKKDEEVPESNYFYQECYWGPFSRSVILPVDVAAERAEAAMKNGVLTIRLPKAEKEQEKKIKVKGLA